MSGLIVGLVLRHPISDAFNTEAKFVATVYADHAWEDGTHAYPAVETVARITGLSDRTVQRYLRALEKLGMLIWSGKGPRGTNQYRFPLETGNDGSVRLALAGGDRLSPRQAVGGDTESGDTESGDTGVTQTNNPSDLVVVITGADEIYKTYDQEFGAPTPMIRDMVNDDIETYSAEWVLEAMEIAVEKNVRRWDYVRGILKRCKAAGKRPSLNRLETKERNHADDGSRTSKRAKANPALALTPADIAAAERINARKQAARV